MRKAFRRNRIANRIFTAGTFIVTLLLLAVVVKGIMNFNSNIDEKQTAAVKAAVQKAVTQCYAVEGTYPSSLEYLEKNYGLVLDTDRYVYDYTVYASNIYPEIFIFKKN